MYTNPKSIHDALRRLTVLIGSAAIDTNAFVDEPEEYSPEEFFEPVALALHDAQVLLRWVREELRGAP
jgi:hypothetical protein